MDRAPETLGEAELDARAQALTILDALCREALEIDFEALVPCPGAQPQTWRDRIRTPLVLGILSFGVSLLLAIPIGFVGVGLVLKPGGEGTMPFVEDLILACEQHGAQDIRRRLVQMRRRALLREAVVDFARALTGEWGRRLHRKLSREEWLGFRATLRSKRALY